MIIAKCAVKVKSVFDIDVYRDIFTSRVWHIFHRPSTIKVMYMYTERDNNTYTSMIDYAKTRGSVTARCTKLQHLHMTRRVRREWTDSQSHHGRASLQNLTMNALVLHHVRSERLASTYRPYFLPNTFQLQTRCKQ